MSGAAISEQSNGEIKKQGDFMFSFRAAACAVVSRACTIRDNIIVEEGILGIGLAVGGATFITAAKIGPAFTQNIDLASGLPTVVGLVGVLAGVGTELIALRPGGLEHDPKVRECRSE